MYSHGYGLFEEYKNASLCFTVFNHTGLPDEPKLILPVLLSDSVNSPSSGH